LKVVGARSFLRAAASLDTNTLSFAAINAFISPTNANAILRSQCPPRGPQEFQHRVLCNRVIAPQHRLAWQRPCIARGWSTWCTFPLNPAAGGEVVNSPRHVAAVQSCLIQRTKALTRWLLSDIVF
jgi:hypothetical protein